MEEIKRVVITAIICIVIFVIVDRVYFSPKLKKIKKLQTTIRQLNQEIHIYLSYRGRDIKKTIKKIEEQNIKLTKIIHHYKQELLAQSEKEFKISNEVDRPAYIFKKKLEETREYIARISSYKKINIPYNLGFGEELPQDNEVNEMSVKLSMIYRFVKTAIECNIKEILDISILPNSIIPVEYKQDKGIELYEFSTTFYTSMDKLIEFLYKLRNYLCIQKVTIESPADKKEILECNITFYKIASWDKKIDKKLSQVNSRLNLLQ